MTILVAIIGLGLLVFIHELGHFSVSLALGMAGAAAVVSVSVLLAKSDFAKPLRYCGRNSIVIYLAFFLPMAASRMVLVKTGWITDVFYGAALILAVTVSHLLQRRVRG